MSQTPLGPEPESVGLFRRRDALIAAGLGAGAVLLGQGGSSALAVGSRVATLASACTLSPEVTEGPYWIANHLTRRDIREHRPGLVLNLTLTVIGATCKAIKGADVEIWHADASGLYSGFGASPGAATNKLHYLRGHQKTDSHGRVLFITIYPGWYVSRTPHIHVKVHVGSTTVHTGQLFFNDTTSDRVYTTSSYVARGQPDTTNATDSVYGPAGGSRALVALQRRSATHLNKGFNGHATLAVR
jgi:protocatechuate 3,4-dioxygenase beta subunit